LIFLALLLDVQVPAALTVTVFPHPVILAESGDGLIDETGARLDPENAWAPYVLTESSAPLLIESNTHITED
jgi:hypothetical protein